MPSASPWASTACWPPGRFVTMPTAFPSALLKRIRSPTCRPVGPVIGVPLFTVIVWPFAEIAASGNWLKLSVWSA